MKHFNTSPRRRFGKIAALGFGAMAALGLASHAWAQHPGRGGDMMGMHGGGPGGQMDAEKMKTFAERRIRRMTSQVGASEAQTNQIVAIMQAAQTDMAATATARQDSRRAIAEALSKPTIDRRALEQLRLQQSQVADRASQRMLQAMADSAEVLDPQQRQKLFELMQSRRGGQRGAATPAA